MYRKYVVNGLSVLNGFYGHAVTRLDTIDIFSYMSGLCCTSLDIIVFAVVENAVLIETEMDSIVPDTGNWKKKYE